MVGEGNAYGRVLVQMCIRDRWYPLLGWKLNPMFGAAAMSLSSFCVVTNALRLNLCRVYAVSYTHLAEHVFVHLLGLIHVDVVLCTCHDIVAVEIQKLSLIHISAAR